MIIPDGIFEELVHQWAYAEAMNKDHYEELRDCPDIEAIEDMYIDLIESGALV